jgi:hypothetical protein
MRFELLPFRQHPAAQMLSRTIIVAAIAATLVIGALYFAGDLSGTATAFSLTGILTITLIAIWRFWRENQGYVSVDDNGVTVKTGAGKQYYDSSSINQVKLMTLAEASGLSSLILRLLGIPMDQSFVEVTLKRWPRVSLLRSEISTQAMGVPRFLTRRLQLYVSQPEEFHNAVAAHTPSSRLNQERRTAS